MSLHNGIYEQVINELLSKQINQEKEIKSIYKKKIDKEEASHILSAYLQDVLRKALSFVSGEDKLQKQIEICNKIIDTLHQELPQDHLHEFNIKRKRTVVIRSYRSGGSSAFRKSTPIDPPNDSYHGKLFIYGFLP